MTRSLLALACGAVCLLAGVAVAQVPVPPELAPYREWVLKDAPDRNCPLRDDVPLCEWTGPLTLDLDAAGGRFDQQLVMDRDALAALPGAPGRWPFDVSVTRLDVKTPARDAAVVDRDGVPTLFLPQGAYRVQGRFAWPALPERLELPHRTALVDLRISGQSVPFPRRDEGGQLWLLAGAAADQQGEQLALGVSRKLEDGVPMIVTTRIALRVAGRAREVNLGAVLPPDTKPLELHSDLPAQLEERGDLRLQVRAGTYRVEIRARTEGSLDKFPYRKAGPAWPSSEVWVWQANEALRQVELSGGTPVDPGRTELDEDWKALPAFMLREGDTLALKTERRGEPSPPPNRLRLQRELWLDLDGEGYTVRDQLQTELHQGFRLDLLQGELGHVATEGEDLLITKAKDGKRSGVELRKREQDLVAEWRAPDRRTTLPAVGWSEDVQSLAATLHLGPGYSLFAARGVDNVSQTWLTDWDLFALFFVLLCAIAASRLAGRVAFVLALATLVLCQQEEGAPQAAWVVLLASIALLRVLPRGFFRNLVRFGYGATVLVLLIVSVPFIADQLRFALHPQLGLGGRGSSFDFTLGMAGAPEATLVHRDEEAVMEAPAEPQAAPAAPMPEGAMGAPQRQMKSAAQLADVLESADQAVEKSRARGGADADGAGYGYDKGGYGGALQQDPEATLQTGPGVPTWRWRSWSLEWSGPVERAHALELYLIPPWANRLLSVLRALLLGLLIIVLMRSATPGPNKPGASEQGSDRPPPDSMRPASTAVATAFALLFGAATTARADFPPQELLDQLRARLTERPACHPNCASIEELALDVDARELRLTLRVHAQAPSSVALPGPAASWVPASARWDGRTDAPLALRGDGFLHARVEPGVHVIELRSAIPPADTLTLAVPDRPHRASVRAEGFKVDGVREDGQVEQALQISRLLKGDREAALATTALPPFLQLERHLELGPIWIVHNRMQRVSPTGTPVRVRVPLLPGESITDSALEVVDGEVQVSFGRDDSEIAWTSRVAVADKLSLAAATGRPFSERWRIACGPIWHCETRGLAPFGSGDRGVYEPQFAPWPGERLELAVARPQPAQGQSVTIDSANLTITPGVRMRKAELQLRLRTSRATTETIELPKGARVQQQTIDGAARPIRHEGTRLIFALGPGAHDVQVQWQEPVGMGFVEAVAPVGLHRPATNAHVTMVVPYDRWLLWAVGPAFGPAILFWGYLLFVLLAAIALARAPHSPLRLHEWLLLGIGLTQIPAPAALAVVVWFFAMAYRARMSPLPRWQHNLGQLALAVLTLFALGCLYGAVHSGLLMQPDMQVAGAGSSGNQLQWYVDRVASALPSVSVVSVPLWTYRLLMLLWSLWLARSLVRWLPWAFRCFKQGGLWLKRKPGTPKTPVPPPPPPPPPAGPSSIPPPVPASQSAG